MNIRLFKSVCITVYIYSLKCDVYRKFTALSKLYTIIAFYTLLKPSLSFTNKTTCLLYRGLYIASKPAMFEEKRSVNRLYVGHSQPYIPTSTTKTGN